MPPFSDDINSHDLSEAPRIERDSQSYGHLVAIGAAVLLLIGLLIYASFPELSPEEIISMDGYEGEQPTKHIFNLQSLEESKAMAKGIAPSVIDQQSSEPQAEDESLTMSEAPAATSIQAPIQVPNEEPPIVETVPLEELPILEPEPEVQVPEITESATVEVEVIEPVVVAEPVEPVQVEVPPEPVIESETTTDVVEPPSQFDTIPEQRVVASMATSPKLEEQPDTVVISTAAIDDLTPLPIGGTTSLGNNNSRLMPLRKILEDATELKVEADDGSQTLMLLGEGVVVSAFERQGEWIYIGTNDGSSATGYVRESRLGTVEPQ